MLPAAAIFGGTVLYGLLLTGLVTAIASFIAGHVRAPLLRLFLLSAGALAFVPGGWGSPADLAKQFLIKLIWVAAVAFGVRYVMRFNLLGCFLVIAGTSLVSGASELFAQPDAFYRANGYAVLFALILLFVWPAAAWRLNSMSASASDAGSVAHN